MDILQPDWINGLIGGLLIGSAASLYLLFNGKIAGISGILGRALFAPKEGTNIAFLAGLIVFPAIAAHLFWDVTPVVTDQIPAVLIGGLLVGFGTRLGSGCTSGHGVCGMSRLSLRSIAATCIFMFFAGITVFVTRHVWGIIS